MPEFVLNRNLALASTCGRVVNFVKGVPVYVVPEMVKEVLNIGAEPVDAEGFDRSETLLGAEADAPASALTPAERIEFIKMAFEQLEAANKREDFTGSGAPHIKAVERVTGFTPDRRERDEAWVAYKEAKVAAADAAEP
jgi:hypothetical protein